MSVFIVGFWLLFLICAAIFAKSKHLVKFSDDNNFRKFQQTYLAIYLLATGDWLQGPYIYALYKHYGFSNLDISKLFVAGYGSSLLFGTIVGSLADNYGRKKNCLLYGAFYVASCITKHFSSYNILLLGRILSGIATSILCSAFESWMVCEHFKGNFDKNSLPTTFSQVVLGNSLVAIISGIVAQIFADKFGFVAPYDVAILILSTMFVLMVFLWNENYGDQKIQLLKSFTNCTKTVILDKKIQCLGIVQSLFEGSMYIFVLEWTPTLTPELDLKGISANGTTSEFLNDHRGKIPHGYIFSTFMVAIMVGSMLFKISCNFLKPERFLIFVLAISSICFLFLALFKVQVSAYICFIIFEMCVGAFWPSIGTLRSLAAIMCLFRVPLNIFVITILLQDLSTNFVFSCCFLFLLLATVVHSRLIRLINSETQVIDLQETNQLMSL